MLRYKIDGIFFLFVLIIALPYFIAYSEEEKPIAAQSEIFERLLREANQDPVPVVAAVIPPKKIITQLKPKKVNVITVTASVYHPQVAQTDAAPLITADGSRINESQPKKHKWIAVSRNLLTRWGGHINYGDKVQVSGISAHLDGVYIVRDTMQRRMRNRIDILVGADDKVMGHWRGVKLTKL